MFPVQIDITSKDQRSVILRYVTDVVHEKLVTFVDCEASMWQYFLDLVKDTLRRLNLDVLCCVGSTTYGAANMQSSYKGFSAFLSGEAPNQIKSGAMHIS